ncbi:3-methyl-2-oxobutanoate hydroxymethyltransferase [Cylindrospermopsis raciborskii S07]|uniref:3-methyl-2-oxobutanoate hydroxymethyltransferase n=3 Tax=Cylindrospermopsis raciborskii TaxID=77022 RepID=A0A853MKK2_9CYAN|nr:3-methyl-2-oxobutanoate hydroxymethyltransferase [Cylindrospermopsis raciborskii]EFA68973.1 Ketopantoate hydroxymethyltransferase [Cylindrospermopsis raciborskii CS-505]MBA4444339.1 3-methyl-2-oxobutanoate hydroxymethyltransferase [Cylindrospermopsis raciborskii CS-506_C]MBA4448556.1 3-methyl-2-oxobutanoate hydroxymethyltransferase [Cylindrospermopsis raciborskii CS-506_D]MBA4455183.1 3-methyl-2-oxobutanoate hydroxymethyltransferase [Cylindrospermopsis raciborskii CS-506_B]MBA4464532.1 3-me
MPINTQQLKQWKQQGRPIVALTAWDYAIAQLLDAAGVDLILVGDSLSVILGYETTLPVTLEEIIHHAKAVKRGIKRALLVVDLPFLTYQESIAQAMQSAGRVLKETGAQGVKLEGGYPAMIDIISRLVQAGIPVLGHLGLTPQSIHQLGLKQQGKTPQTADLIFHQAIALEQAGVFALVLEHIPSHLAVKITKELSIPTIGIGAGQECNGQILVTSDVLGLSEKQPPFAKVYTDLRQEITKAVEKYALEVRNQDF